MISTSRQHKCCICIWLNVANSIWVAIKYTLTFKKPGLVLRVCIEMNNWCHSVFSTNHECVPDFFVISDTATTVKGLWVCSFWVPKVIVFYDKPLGRDWSNIQDTFVCGGKNVLLVVCKVTRDHNRFRLLVDEDGFLWLSDVVQNDKLVAATSCHKWRIVVPSSIVSLKIWVNWESITFAP